MVVEGHVMARALALIWRSSAKPFITGAGLPPEVLVVTVVSSSGVYVQAVGSAR
jgi:hypothetical protein